MATLSEYFESEAREILSGLDQALKRLPLPDAGELQRSVRALRGTAQMAREERVFRAASAFEDVMRAFAANALSWSEELAGRAQETLADLQALVERSEDDDQLDARADAAVERWQRSGVSMPAWSANAPAADAPEAGRRQFRAFAADEVAGIAEALDTGIQQLGSAPMDREPLRMILRRQRALLGAARLDDVPVVAEVLRAVEDLTRVIVKLDVGVKQEWLDVYRVARDGLRGTIQPLREDRDPEPSHPVSRLRHMRAELLERYGAGEAVSAAHEDGLVQAQTTDAQPVFAEPGPAPEPAAADADARDVVPIEELCYTADSALARALELRDVVAAAAVHDPRARAAVDELFDLIRLARDS